MIIPNGHMTTYSRTEVAQDSNGAVTVTSREPSSVIPCQIVYSDKDKTQISNESGASVVISRCRVYISEDGYKRFAHPENDPGLVLLTDVETAEVGQYRVESVERLRAVRQYVIECRLR